MYGSFKNTDYITVVNSLLGTDYSSVFSTSFSHIGVSCGCHESSGTVCCIGFAQDLIDQRQTYTSLPTPRSGEGCSTFATEALTYF